MMDGIRVIAISVLAASIFITSCERPEIEAVARPALENNGFQVFVGATLIDGTGRAPLESAIIIVKDGKVVAVGTAESVDVPAAANIIDVTGTWVVPGLIDAHTHFFESGRIYTKPGSLNLTHLVSYAEEVAWMQQRVPVTLKSYLCAGVTSNVSVGGPRFEYEVRAQANNISNAPNVFVAHGPITLVPADGLLPLFDGDRSIRSVVGTDSARAMVRQATEWGADLIKTAYLGGPFASIEEDYVDVHKAILAEARVNGLLVTTHATELEPARKLVELGVDSLQHLPTDRIVDQEFVNLVKSRGTIVVPTLALWPRSHIEIFDQSQQLEEIETKCGDPEVIRSWFEVDDLLQPDSDSIDRYEARFRTSFANARVLYEAGVPIAVGTDAGNPGLLHGASIHYELKLLAQLGMSPNDLIVAATLNAARVAGKADLVGSVEAGKLADFLILEADPLEDIANLQKIQTIVKSGVVFAQEELLPPDLNWKEGSKTWQQSR